MKRKFEVLELTLENKLSAPLFSSILEPITYINRQPRKPNPVTRQYEVYPIAGLPELLGKLSSSGKAKLRYLVDPNFQLWFALEGRPGLNIPAHQEMAVSGRCIAAGNIKISQGNPLQINLINHKSGDFHPEYFSMQWVLAILIANEQQLPVNFLPSEITLQELNQNGGVIGSTLWSKAKLIEETASIIKQFPQIATQPTEKQSAAKILGNRQEERTSSVDAGNITSSSTSRYFSSGAKRQMLFGGEKKSLFTSSSPTPMSEQDQHPGSEQRLLEEFRLNPESPVKSEAPTLFETTSFNFR